MKLANPAPLGLMGFGMTTVLLNIHNIGAFDQGAMIVGMGAFYGGLAQIFAGILEFFQGNTFGFVAFTSYGLFWETLVVILCWEPLDLPEPERAFVGWYLFMWGVFTMFMTLGTIKKNLALMNVFASLTTLFYLLALGHWVKDDDWSKTITKIAGYEGIWTGASAMYVGFAEILNDAWGGNILPLFNIPWPFFKRVLDHKFRKSGGVRKYVGLDQPGNEGEKL